jgi:hypothetical protein
MSTKLLNPFSSDLRGKQRAKPVPPKPHSLMADFNPALMKQIFHIPERKRKPNVKHHCQADDFGAGFEVPEWTAF